MKIAVAMSGGVDSSVTALKLKEEGHQVMGITMRMDGMYEALAYTGLACADAGSAGKAEEIAKKIGIPLYQIDVSAAFKKNVLEYLKNEYLSGKTPNPCVRCNMTVKFGAFLDGAAQTGLSFDKVATGHYARIIYNEETGLFELRKGVNIQKDQSYFLAMLSQAQIAQTLFPLGDVYSKDEIWGKAMTAGLPFSDKTESQDFLSGNYLDAVGVTNRKGKIVFVNGTILGEHNGFWHYTIGQRKGLGVSFTEPLYVTGLDPVANTVFVGRESDLYNDTFEVGDLNWISGALFSGAHMGVKIRYRSRECGAKIIDDRDAMVRVLLDAPQKSITSGQFAVFYDNDIVRGGGVIL